jgi:hypothetical protein
MVVQRRAEAESQANGDGRPVAFLSLYQTMCEAVVSLIAAPVIVGFCHVYGIPTQSFVFKPDGRVDINALEKMEDWLLAPSNLLKVGLNKHVRNAYSHSRYRILDGSRVQMWDETNQGKPTWGPEEWTFTQIEALCSRLELTCVAIVIALAVFGLNYSELIKARGWVPKDRQQPPLRLQEAHDLLAHTASNSSMLLKDFSLQDKTLHFELSTRPRGNDHVEARRLYGGASMPLYQKPVKYVSVPIAPQVIQILRAAAGHVDDADVFSASIKNHDGEQLGEFHIDRAALGDLSVPLIGGVTKLRALAKVDTLGDSMMWLEELSLMAPLRP